MITSDQTSETALATSAICPAPVVALELGQPQVLINGVPRQAQIALAYGYRPMVGDEVLIADGGNAVWVIGVLRAQAPVEISVDGDLRLRAPRGSIELHARDGVAVHGRLFRVCTQMVEVVTHTLRQRLDTLIQHMSGAWSSRCKSRQSVVEGARLDSAERAHVRTEKEYTLNGSTIHLG